MLYSMNTVWVDIEKQGRSFIIKDGERARLDKAYLGMLQRLGLKPASAGGLQSLLTPKNTVEAPWTDAQQQNANPPAPAAAAQSAPAGAGQPAAAQQPPAASETAPAPAAEPPQSAYEYVVVEARVQGGMKGSNTLVILQNADGKRTQAFARGSRTELATGVHLTSVKLTLRRQDTVAYYVLESYELSAPQPAAA